MRCPLSIFNYPLINHTFKTIMLLKAKFTFLLVFISVIAVQAHHDFISLNDYINKYKDIAIGEMERTGIPASIKLGQGIMESVHGNSKLARNSNNHFGIKCKKEWTGKKYFHKDDDRNKRGKLIKSCFRVYPSVYDSYVDHSDFLTSRDRYAGLFAFSSTDYVNWANGLKSAGYATASHYATKLIEIIEKNNLQQYDFTGSKIAVLTKDNWTPVRPKTKPVVVRYERINLKNAKMIEQRRPLMMPNLENQPSSDIMDLIYGESYFPAQNQEQFLINGLKTIALKDGLRIENIAKQYDLKTKKLLQYNDLIINQPLLRGQYIFLESKKKTNDITAYHKAQKGETLYIIAQKYGVQLSKLQSYNPKLTNPVLMAGTLVKLNNKKSISIQKAK